LVKAEKCTTDRLVVSTQIEAISENPPLAPGADEPKIRTEELWSGAGEVRRTTTQLSGSGAHGPAEKTFPYPSPASSPSWRWQKVGPLLCAVLLIVGGVAALGASLKARTGGSTDAASVNIETRTASVPDNDEPRQSITNAVKSSVATQASSRWNFVPLDPHRPIPNWVKSSAAMPSLPPLPRHRPMNSRLKRKSPRRQPIPHAVKFSAAAPSLPPLPRDHPTNSRSVAIPLRPNGSCSHGWARSGSFCLRSGSGR
jgi:hypothetical protein